MSIEHENPYKFPDYTLTVEEVATHAASIVPVIDFLGEMKHRIKQLDPHLFVSVNDPFACGASVDAQQKIDAFLPTINAVLRRECLASELFAACPEATWSSVQRVNQWLDGTIKRHFLNIRTKESWSTIADVKRKCVREPPSLFARIVLFADEEAKRLRKLYAPNNASSPSAPSPITTVRLNARVIEGSLRNRPPASNVKLGDIFIGIDELGGRTSYIACRHPDSSTTWEPLGNIESKPTKTVFKSAPSTPDSEEMIGHLAAFERHCHATARNHDMAIGPAKKAIAAIAALHSAILEVRKAVDASIAQRSPETWKDLVKQIERQIEASAPKRELMFDVQVEE